MSIAATATLRTPITASASLNSTIIAGGVTPSGILYQRPQLTGQTTSYANNDDGWNLNNGIYTYNRPPNPINIAELSTSILLKEDNAFGSGNKSRITDSVGGQDYDGTAASLVDYIICHLTGLGYLWLNTNTPWATQLTTATGATNLGFSDWRVANLREALNLKEFIDPSTSIGWLSPIINTSWTTTAIWTSTTAAAATTSAWQLATTNFFFSASAKTTSRRILMVRNHYT